MLNFFKDVLKGYAKVERHVYYFIAACFVLQLIDAALFILLNYYLRDLSYSDTAIADLVSYRFLAVMVVAFPLGFFIKGRYLKPFFYFSAIAGPLFTFTMLLSIEAGQIWLAKASMIGFGVARICIKVAGLPYLILNAKKEYHSEAFSMYFQVFSGTIFVSGMLYYFLHAAMPLVFTEREALWAFGAIGLVAVYFIYKIDIKEEVGDKVPVHTIFKAYDWGIIAKVAFPVFLIALGAGFSIPFINLFFESVHGMPSDDFSFYRAFSAAMVTVMMFLIPMIRRRFGYGVSITLFQSLALIAFVVMVTTQWYADWEYAAIIATFMFLARRPLMGGARPATSELSLYYVGKRNQEMVSAINASIWSGSTFFSAIIFGWLRSMNLPYVNIFLLTAILYAVAIIWYVFLIRSFSERASEAQKRETEES